MIAVLLSDQNLKVSDEISGSSVIALLEFRL